MFVFVQAEDGIRDLVRSRGLGDVYKRQAFGITPSAAIASQAWASISYQMRNLVSGDQIATMSLIHI